MVPALIFDVIGQKSLFYAVITDKSVVFTFSLATLVILMVIVRMVSLKGLRYEIIADAPVFSGDEEGKNRVKIELDGYPVEEASFAVLKISNIGNTLVKKDDYKDDYKEPVAFLFKGRKVIGSEIIGTEPKKLIDEDERKMLLAETTTGQNTLGLPKIRLSSRQSVTLSVFLAGAKDEIEVTGKIMGKRVQQVHTNKVKSRTYNYTVVIIALIVIGLSTFIGNITGGTLGLITGSILGVFFGSYLGTTMAEYITEREKAA